MISIIDNTLRDGSYVLNFQFSKEQTYNITKGVFSLGIDLIEVGHGLGLGAWNNSKIGLSKENDIAYIRAAKDAAPKAKIGVFFIPGIGTKKDIDIAYENGIDFIRIGNNIDTYKKAREYAKYAKEKGLFVALNLMKSYAVKSYEFTVIAKEIERWGTVDVVYLVDSAGCMFPEEVFEFIEKTRDKVVLPIGFHGHNNLSLAIANSIQAIKAGATYIDTAIRGMGRSAGNTQTEIMIYYLQKMKLTNIKSSLYDFYSFANDYIVPIMPISQGLSDEDIHIGVSKFHTSFQTIAEKVSKEYNVDFKVLIKAVSEIDCTNPSEELFIKIAKKI